MKVTVLNPPYFKLYSRSSRSPAVTRSRTLYYPYWLAYAVGVLEQKGFEVQFIDAPAMDIGEDEVIKKVVDYDPELLVVDSTTASFYSDAAILGKIKKETGSVSIMVGTHVSATVEESLRSCEDIDGIARREYDYIIRDIAVKIKEGDDYHDVNGLSYIKDGQATHNPDMPYIQNLDELPFVSEVYHRHFKECYRSYFYGANLHPIMVILSGRGCPFKCIYCVYPQVMTGHRFRVRSPNNLVDELEYIKSTFPDVKDIFIEDDTFTINKKRVREICSEIIKRKLKITWSTNSRADVDHETLNLMKKAGCRELCVGFESGDQEVLDNIGKKLKLDQQFAFMSGTKKAGIIVHGCFLVGNPGETRETLNSTLDLALKLNPDTAQFYPIMVYPGTKAYEWADNQGFITTKKYDEWLTVDGQHSSVVKRDNLSHEELVKWGNEARRRFYLRPSYIVSKLLQVITHPKETKRIIMASRTLVKHLFG